jgi:hypothetical protein
MEKGNLDIHLATLGLVAGLGSGADYEETVRRILEETDPETRLHLDEYLVKFEMISIARAEKRSCSVMCRNQMAEDIDRAISPWRDLPMELILGKSEKDVPRPPDCEVPVGKSG